MLTVPMSCASAVALLLSCPQGRALNEVIFVDHQAAGISNGSSWQDAFTDLQQALAMAQPGDQVWVAGGTYNPDEGTLDKKKRFDVPSGVSLFGGFAGTETTITQRNVALHPSLLSGDLLGNDGPDLLNYADNSYEVMRATSPAPGTRVDGFTIVAGNGTSVTVALQAGGLFVTNGTIDVANCTFISNYQEVGSGAIRTENCTVSIVDCDFVDNHSNQGPGAVTIAEGSVARITRCRFLDNDGPLLGGALACWENSEMTVENCLFTGNHTFNYGGAIVVTKASADFTNCTMTGNVAGGGGGALSLGAPCIVSVANCILWGNIGASAPGENEISPEGMLSVNYTTLSPPIQQFGGTGNSTLDPLFVDADGDDNAFGTFDDDCRLQPGSPCIDSGWNALAASDWLDADCDGNVVELVPVDLQSVGRFEDAPDTADLVGQQAPVIDRGAYEFSRWINLEHGLGDAKSPCLIGSGSWKPGLPLGLTITGTKPNAFGLLFVGATEIDTPFKGGVMVPQPFLGVGLLTDASGQLAAQGMLPASMPPGFETFIQAWFVDASGPKGFTATNAAMGTTP